MQVPSQKFYRTSGRLDSATAPGDAMTSRFVKALSNPYLQICAHVNYARVFISSAPTCIFRSL